MLRYDGVAPFFDPFGEYGLMAQEPLHFLPRCPACAARLPVNRLLTLDTRQVVPCKQCQSPMQIDVKITVIDWLIQTVIYVPIALYGLYAALYLADELGVLKVSILVAWFLATLIAGQCVWRVFFPRVRAWEPACLKCGYNLTGLTSDNCPECGKDFDPKRYNQLSPGWLACARVIWRMTVICFAAVTLFDFLILNVAIPYMQSSFRPIEHVGYPFAFLRATGTTHFSNWSWHWDALVDNFALCLLAGFVLGLFVISRKMRQRDQQTIHDPISSP